VNWSWPTVDPKFTHGELVQIALSVATLATGVWFWCSRKRKERDPLSILLREGELHCKKVKLAVGTHAIRLALSSHVARTSSHYQFDVVERGWKSFRRTWVTPPSPVVSMFAVVVQAAGPPRTNGTYTGPPAAHLRVAADFFFRCEPGLQAIIDLSVTATAPWKGGIRIEISGSGAMEIHATIPVSVTDRR
jgi:hypothetical protein